MNRKLWLQTASILSLAIAVAGIGAQEPAPATGIQVKASRVRPESASQTAVTVGNAFLFQAAGVGGSPRHFLAEFSMPAGATPTAAMHYGRDYQVGSLHCASNGATQDCSADITFTPTLPGARPDAIFFSVESMRVGSVLLNGVGEAPLSLLQATSVLRESTKPTVSRSVVDEQGTLYTLESASGLLTSITAAGSSKQLFVTGLVSPRSLAIDGAGVLYVLDASSAARLITFDTVQGITSSIALPEAASRLDAIALDASGTILALTAASDMRYSITTDGTVSGARLNLDSSVNANAMIAAQQEEWIMGGATLQRLTSSGVQAISSDDVTKASGAVRTPLTMDAAGTLYVRSGVSLLQFAAPAYTSSVLALPAADAVGSDGTLYFSDPSKNTLGRSQASLSFARSTPAVGLETQHVSLYNGGNLPLSISDIRIAGAAFSFAPSNPDSCAAGRDVAMGAICDIAVQGLPGASREATGSITVTSNSLNRPSTHQVVELALNPAVGSAVTLTPTTLPFPATTVNIASAPLTVALMNTGTAALNFASIGLGGIGSGSYSLTHNCYTALPASLAPGASCTLTVIFKPLAASAQNALISIVDDAGGVAGSIQTAAVTGTGVAVPAPIVTIAPNPVTFGSLLVPIVVGSSSAPVTLTVTNSGNAVANISSLTLTTALANLSFSQTNTCGATLAPAATCTVTVLFTPIGGGSVTAKVSVVDDAPLSPQVSNLIGIGAGADFNMSTPDLKMTLPASGGTGTVTVIATPNPGPFVTPITFTAFGLPKNATISFSPSSITPSASPASSVVTISIPEYHAVVLAGFGAGWPSRHPLLPVVALLLAGLCATLRSRKLPRLTRAATLVMLAAIGMGAMSISGCTGGFPVSSGVAPGTYAITVTGASLNGAQGGNLSAYPTNHNATFNLIVQ